MTSRANAVYICGDQLTTGTCPRCGLDTVVQGLGYFPPECTSCTWDAATGPEEWQGTA